MLRHHGWNVHFVPPHAVNCSFCLFPSFESELNCEMHDYNVSSCTLVVSFGIEVRKKVMSKVTTFEKQYV